jgi:hypothetical protein
VELPFECPPYIDDEIIELERTAERGEKERPVIASRQRTMRDKRNLV